MTLKYWLIFVTQYKQILRADNILAELQSSSSELFISSSALLVNHSMHMYIQSLDRRRLNILAQQSTHASQLLYWLF